MSIFVIADLHLSFKNPKPMDIFGDNWTKHEEKIKKDWNEKVKEEDLVVLPGDFSWATYIEDTIPDFEYLNSLPGKKIMLKGNHDYWWTTVTSMRKFLKENNFQNIDFLYNNSFEYENKILSEEEMKFIELMKKYNVKRCYYGHLHGNSIYDAIEGKIQGIELKLVSADGLDFKLIKI